MKNDTHNKLVIISVLILIPIGILYFNMGDKVFNTKENLANVGNNFVNICDGKKSNIYNINKQHLHSFDWFRKEYLSYISGGDLPDHEAENVCKNICSTFGREYGVCDLYTMKDGDCSIHWRKSRDVDPESTLFEVNCDNKILPVSGPGASSNTFIGEGKIESTFYKDNKKNFKHIDYLLDSANEIKADYMKINEELETIKSDPLNIRDREKLRGQYDEVDKKIEKVGDFLDLDRNNLYGDFVTSTESKYARRDYLNKDLGGKNLTFKEMIKKFKKQKEDTNNIEARTINDSLAHDRKYLMYMILCVLMILSIVIIIIFKMAPNLISDKTVIAYFIGVLFLLFFIHYYLRV